ncbi:hypothetical protein [Nitrospira sp. Nam80]
MPRTACGFAAERRGAKPVEDAANRGGGDPDPMDAVEPNAGADRPVLEVPAGVLDQRYGRVRNAARADGRIARN